MLLRAILKVFSATKRLIIFLTRLDKDYKPGKTHHVILEQFRPFIKKIVKSHGKGLN